MASASGIRAAKAYVELYIKSGKLDKGLKTAQERLHTFGKTIKSAGFGALKIGAIIGAPIIAAIKKFASYGDMIAKTSKRTGVAIETLSRLNYVASQTGTDFGVLTKSVGKMQRSVYDLNRGLKTQKDVFSDIGLTANDLSGLSQEEQFLKIGDALSKIEDDGKRAAIAMNIFGRNGSMLLPMFENGAKGVQTLLKKADSLKLTISKEDAKNAEDLTDAFDNLSKTTQAAAFSIGATLAPEATSLLNKLSELAVNTVDYVKENKDLVVTAVKVAAGITALGGSLLVASGICKILAVSAGALRIALLIPGNVHRSYRILNLLLKRVARSQIAVAAANKLSDWGGSAKGLMKYATGANLAKGGIIALTAAASYMVGLKIADWLRNNTEWYGKFESAISSATLAAAQWIGVWEKEKNGKRMLSVAQGEMTQKDIAAAQQYQTTIEDLRKAAKEEGTGIAGLVQRMEAAGAKTLEYYLAIRKLQKQPEQGQGGSGTTADSGSEVTTKEMEKAEKRLASIREKFGEDRRNELEQEIYEIRKLGTEYENLLKKLKLGAQQRGNTAAVKEYEALLADAQKVTVQREQKAREKAAQADKDYFTDQEQSLAETLAGITKRREEQAQQDKIDKAIDKNPEQAKTMLGQMLAAARIEAAQAIERAEAVIDNARADGKKTKEEEAAIARALQNVQDTASRQDDLKRQLAGIPKAMQQAQKTLEVGGTSSSFGAWQSLAVGSESMDTRIAEATEQAADYAKRSYDLEYTNSKSGSDTWE